MAGNTKPSNVGTEMTSYSIVGENGSAPAKALFDGVLNGPFSGTSATAYYWNTVGQYVSIKIDKPCYIWRCGQAQYLQHCNKLQITKNGVDVSNTVRIADPTKLAANAWEKIYKIIEPGVYDFRFIQNNWRIDSEWYMEDYPEGWDELFNSLTGDKLVTTILACSVDIFMKYIVTLKPDDVMAVLTALDDEEKVEALKNGNQRLYIKWNNIHHPIKYFSQANVAYLLSELTERIKQSHINE